MNQLILKGVLRLRIYANFQKKLIWMDQLKQMCYISIKKLRYKNRLDSDSAPGNNFLVTFKFQQLANFTKVEDK